MLKKSGIALLFLAAIVSMSCAMSKEDEYRWKREKKSWSSLCKCANAALGDIKRLLAEYTARLSTRNPISFDLVVGNVTEIAYNCTKTPECRCPEGYFKTRDGNSCLKISEDEVDCDQAVKLCSEEANARLAVAKDHQRLTKLADYIREVDPTDEEYYWIGLSYNHTDNGVPVWTWEDGSTASYSITTNLKNNVRKSLIRLHDGMQTLERVAISKDYNGAHWKQEKCGVKNSSRGIPKHKYICEFSILSINLKPVTVDLSERKKTAVFN